MYFLIGISLIFAYLLTINWAVSLLLAGVWRLVEGRAESWRASSRAGVLFAFRVLPMSIAIVTIVGLILPSYLLYEPRASGETIGWKMMAVTAVSAVGLLTAGFRLVGSWWRTRRLRAEWMAMSWPISLPLIDVPVYRMRHPYPVIAVVGTLRPRVFLAESLLTDLEPSELAASISHEFGHIASRDNVKRLMMRVCGDLLVFKFGTGLDTAWADSTEIAADEYAANTGGREVALELASALIKIGRATPDEAAWATPLGSFLIGGRSSSLKTRIERLLRLSESDPSGIRVRTPRSVIAFILALSVAILFAVIPMLGRSLASVHSLTESLFAALN
ncbi:MAG: M48 family metalloprotease [Acidobacteria bacterium]|nr:M48 family metalloprotease [Acidobacteriota bacterium]